MSTKNDPGPYDCYAKLADDEPYFVLRGKDPAGPDLVRAWRYLRAGMLQDALNMVSRANATVQASEIPLLPIDSPKSLEASETAAAMASWRERVVLTDLDLAGDPEVYRGGSLLPQPGDPCPGEDDAG